MNKITLSVSTLIVTAMLHCLPIPAQAQTAPLPATNAAEIDPEAIKSNLMERIQNVLGQNNSATNPSFKGWYGQVESLSQETITLLSNGISRLIGFNTDTAIISDGTAADIESIEIDSYLVAIGEVGANDILTADRLITLEDPALSSKKISLLATIEDLTPSRRQLTLASTSAHPTITLSYTSASSLSDQPQSDTGGYADLSASELNPGDEVLVVYQPQTKDPSLLSLLILHRITPAPLELDSLLDE